MAHRFSVKDIAVQAGVGTATVDRVLHKRGSVRAQTAQRVFHAIEELEAQSRQLSLGGRPLIVDLVVEAPQVFRDALDAALTAELPLMQPAAFRVRRDMRGQFPVPDIERALARARRLGSHGVIIMAPDTEPIRRAMANLEASGIPVVTLATDMPGARRRAYVGLDNPKAGATAAWFVRQWLPGTVQPRIVVTVRNRRFRGEEQRRAGFARAIARHFAKPDVEVLVEGTDRADFLRRFGDAAAQERSIDAIYSIGGGNRRLLDVLDAASLPRPLMIGHDLNAENRELLRDGLIDLLLYHDLNEDLRNACRVIIAARGRPGRAPPVPDGALHLMVPPMAGKSG